MKSFRAPMEAGVGCRMRKLWERLGGVKEPQDPWLVWVIDFNGFLPTVFPVSGKALLPVFGLVVYVLALHLYFPSQESWGAWLGLVVFFFVFLSKTLRITKEQAKQLYGWGKSRR